MFSYWRIRDDSSQSVTAKLGALTSFEPTERKMLVLPAKWDVRVVSMRSILNGVSRPPPLHAALLLDANLRQW